MDNLFARLSTAALAAQYGNSSATRTAATRSVSSACAQPASSVSRKVPCAPVIPTQFTTIAAGPKVRVTWSRNRSTAAASVRSAANAARCSLSVITTFAPSPRSSRAVSRPMPLSAPVTTATLPEMA